MLPETSLRGVIRDADFKYDIRFNLTALLESGTDPESGNLITESSSHAETSLRGVIRDADFKYDLSFHLTALHESGTDPESGSFQAISSLFF